MGPGRPLGPVIPQRPTRPSVASSLHDAPDLHGKHHGITTSGKRKTRKKKSGSGSVTVSRIAVLVFAFGIGRNHHMS